MAKKETLEQFHREMISAAADRLFSRQGMEKTTMDDIAREAEYSKATLYVYFKGKDEIFYYIVLKGMNLLHKTLQQALSEHEGARDAYCAMCCALAEYCDEHPLYFDSILETVASDAESRAASQVLSEIYTVGEELNQDVEALIRRGTEQGVFRAGLPTLPTGLVHWAALCGIISLANKKRDYICQRMGMDRGEFMHFGFDMLLRSILPRSEEGWDAI